MLAPVPPSTQEHHCGPLWRHRGAGPAARSSTQAYGVPDTVLGRFDMIVLHLVLLLRRLREGDAGIASWRRACSTRSAATWTTICARWASAIRACRARCAGSARRSMAAPRPMRRRLGRAGGRALGGGARPQRLRRVAEPPVAAVPLATYVRQAVRRAGRAGARRAWRRQRALSRAGARGCGSDRGVSDDAERPWSVTVRLDEVPESGRHVDARGERGDARGAGQARPASMRSSDSTRRFDLTPARRATACMSAAGSTRRCGRPAWSRSSRWSTRSTRRSMWTLRRRARASGARRR